MKLTKLLYLKDECQYTLLVSILSKKNINECYFWTCELYISGYIKDLWKFIFEIYYTFYNIKSPALLDFINKYYNKWNKKKNILHVLNIIKKLFHSKFCFTVFNHIFTQPTLKSLKGRKPKCISKYKNISKNDSRILLSIYRKRYGDVYHYLSLCDSIRDTKELIEEYINKSLGSNNEDLIPPQNILFSNLLKELFRENGKQNENVKKNAQEKKKLTKQNLNDILKNHTIDKNPRLTLLNRKYNISDKIGCFVLDNINHNKKHDILNNWMYYAYRYSRYWNRIFKKFKINLDTKNKYLEIIDDNTTNFDDFHNCYNIEGDEQSLEIKNKSCVKIKNTSIMQFQKYFMTS